MLLAPILAVALVFSIAVAVTYLPTGPQPATQNQPSPEPTPANYYNVTAPIPSPTANFSTGSIAITTPAPTVVPAAPTVVQAAPTTPPTAIPATGLGNTNNVYFPILSIIAALIIGVVAALLLFSERNLKKELGNEEQP